MADQIIKQIKLPDDTTSYEIGAKYDVDNNEIKNTYATKAELQAMIADAITTALNKAV